MAKCKPVASQVLKAEYDAVLNIGGVELPCYVLNNGVRALSQAGVLNALGMSFGGGPSSGPDRLARFVASERLKPYVSDGLTDRSTSPLLFHPKGGGPVVRGYEATVLADLCDAIMRADIEGVLQKQQAHIAMQARVVALGFMKVGIVAVVDEATGYQQQRAPDALQALLGRLLRETPGPRVKRFTTAFYNELYRLTGLPKRGGNHPRYFAALTRDLIYRRMGAPGLVPALEERNPSDANGNRQARHHQFLSDDFGVEVLIGHLHALLALMKLAKSLKQLRHLANQALPRLGDTLSLPLSDDLLDERDRA
ncbi:P63C domain-containing protein [Corallococcus silvisoli]|uniref:P63C domain-containing protein n=1 Tax=Corallococcus silvisoli TaxID=2697031 RepID=UPI001377858B|nr:P63C domain-containing protein [Corallococcus silvisoli]NBD11837.1 hypothetical protein [Corallococcus silvisoli]